MIMNFSAVGQRDPRVIAELVRRATMMGDQEAVRALSTLAPSNDPFSGASADTPTWMPPQPNVSGPPPMGPGVSDADRSQIMGNYQQQVAPRFGPGVPQQDRSAILRALGIAEPAPQPELNTQQMYVPRPELNTQSLYTPPAPNDPFSQVASTDPFEAPLPPLAGNPQPQAVPPLPASLATEDDAESRQNRQDAWDTLLEFGLATMAAADRPGASTLGALGAGGAVALAGARNRQSDREDRAFRDEQQARQDERWRMQDELARDEMAWRRQESIDDRAFQAEQNALSRGNSAAIAAAGRANRENTVVINGRLVNRDTGEVIADYSDQATGTTYSQLSPEEVQAMGLPAGTIVQRSSTGQMSIVREPNQPDPADPQDVITNANMLRDDFNASQVVKNYYEASNGLAKVENAATLDSAAGDVALIFGFMKTIDPTSTVREGEFATVQNSGSVEQRIINLYNQALTGERLTQEQREDFTAAARGQFQSYVDPYNQMVADYTQRAQSIGVNPADVVGSVGQRPTSPAAPAMPPPGPIPPGFRQLEE